MPQDTVPGWGVEVGQVDVCMSIAGRWGEVSGGQVNHL